VGLHNLKPAKGSVRNRKRVGRGPGSGLGKTAGRGEKGQKSRSGFSRKPGFEGGQMPLHRRMPKRGFHNIFRREYAVINLGRLQKAIEAGKLDLAKPINAEALIKANILRRARDGMRLLAKGEIKSKVTIEVAGASQAAIAAVEKAGGKVVVLRSKAEAAPKTPKKKESKAAQPEAS